MTDCQSVSTATAPYARDVCNGVNFSRVEGRDYYRWDSALRGLQEMCFASFQKSVWLEKGKRHQEPSMDTKYFVPLRIIP